MKWVTVAGLVCGIGGAILIGSAQYISGGGKKGDLRLSLTEDARQRVLRKSVQGWILLIVSFTLQLVATLASD